MAQRRAYCSDAVVIAGCSGRYVPSISWRMWLSSTFAALRFTMSTADMIIPAYRTAHCSPCARGKLPAWDAACRPGRGLRCWDLGAVAGGGEYRAHLVARAVDVHHAGAALARVATHVRAGEALIFADDCTSKVRGSMSALTALPLTVIDTLVLLACAAPLLGASDAVASASFLRKNMRRLLIAPPSRFGAACLSLFSF